jgi:hypothetical protein
MIRFSVVVSLFLLVGCGADQSRGSALNECRMQYYMDSPAAQGQLIPDCMAAKSLASVIGCGPSTDDDEWDWQVRAFAYDNPRCYRPIGTEPWTATLLSPM